MAKKRNLKASDIDKLENTSLASALSAVEGAHVHSDVDCIGVSCVGVSCNGLGSICTGAGVCCTGCTGCSGCTACSNGTACVYKSNF
jgi:hypothetical protein